MRPSLSGPAASALVAEGPAHGHIETQLSPPLLKERYVNKEFRLAALTLMSAMVVTSCGGGSGTDAAAPPPPVSPPPADYAIRDVLPQMIDSSATADNADDYHVIIPPVSGVTPVNKLFVFLPGTDGVPNMYQLILKAGASRGYHTIGLAYWNQQAIGVLCAPGNTDDANCFWDARRAVITGDADSPDIAISKPNSIVTRLTKAITYLNTTYPTEGWGQYLLNGAPDWSKIVVGGHSQGGGHAGVMSKLYSMSRACYFASPPDWDLTTNSTAPWESYANVTPASLQYGFAGLQDPSVPWAELSQIWNVLGLSAFGGAVQVDNVASPYGNSHMLTTDAQPNTSTDDPGTPLHGVTVRDAFTPLTSTGTPLFDPVWAYMCFQ